MIKNLFRKLKRRIVLRGSDPDAVGLKQLLHECEWRLEHEEFLDIDAMLPPDVEQQYEIWQIVARRRDLWAAITPKHFVEMSSVFGPDDEPMQPKAGWRRRLLKKNHNFR